MDSVTHFLLESLVILIKIYLFVHRAMTQSVTGLDLFVAIVVLLLFFALIYGILAEIVWLLLTCVPYLSKNPPLYPSSSEYEVRFGSHEIASRFSWEYPYLIVDGARYNMRRAVTRNGKRPRAILPTGTVIEFIKR